MYSWFCSCCTGHMSRSPAVQQQRCLPQCLYAGPVQEDSLFAPSLPFVLPPHNGLCQGEKDSASWEPEVPPLLGHKLEQSHLLGWLLCVLYHVKKGCFLCFVFMPSCHNPPGVVTSIHFIIISTVICIRLIVKKRNLLPNLSFLFFFLCKFLCLCLWL